MFSLFNRFKVRFGKGRGSRHIKFQYEVKVALLLGLQGCFVNRVLFIQSKMDYLGRPIRVVLKTLVHILC